MKHTGLLILISCVTMVARGQLPFLDMAYKTALDRAAREDKLVCLLYASADCESCNEALYKRLGAGRVKQQIARSFIPVRIGPESGDREHIRQLFDLKMSSGILFVDDKNNLIYSVPYNIRISVDSLLNEALRRQRSIAILKEKEKSYFGQNGKNIRDLEALIAAKTTLEQDTRLLLTEYLSLVPKDSINTMPVLQFLARQAPVYESRAYVTMVRSPLFSEAWYSIPVETRSRINVQIFEKSAKVAADTEDEAFAGRIARFAASTYNNEPGRKYAQRRVMMYFYLRTKDITRYLDVAAPFYDDYLQFVVAETTAQPAAAPAEDLPEALLKMNTATAVNTVSPAVYARYLSDAAVFFYRNDSAGKYLSNALAWADKSVALAPGFLNQHVYALLLYSSGEKERAIRYETLAIAESKKVKAAYTADWPRILEKMKKGERISPAGGGN